MQRIITLALISSLLPLAVGFTHWLKPTALTVADKLLGETWYRLELNDEHVGFMHNHAYKDLHGHYHFTTTTHFRLQAGTPSSVSKEIVFTPSDHYALGYAKYVNRERQQSLSVEIHRIAAASQGNSEAVHRSGEPSAHQYTATVENAGHRRQQLLDWEFRLSDFVALEAWLHQSQPLPGARKQAKSPDFERMSITHQGFRVADKNAHGYLLENDAPLAAHQIQLDQNYRPANMFMSGTFNFVTTHRADAIDIDRASARSNYLFATDRKIEDHTKVAALTLEVASNTDHLPNQWSLTAGTAQQHGQPQDYLASELRYPVDLPEIQNMAAELTEFSGATAHTPSAELTETHVHALTHKIHRRLHYTESQPAGSVIQALERGRGECTDYADLFTTVARAAGIPARTVYGLVYRDARDPGFAFHAWNEVYFDAQWHAVDPTWDQTNVDATHLQLSDVEAGAMLLAHSRKDLLLKVSDVRYIE